MAPGARQLLVDRQGTLWVATNGMNFGLSKDSIRVNTILKLPADRTRFEPTGQPVGFVSHLAESPNGQVWMAEASGLVPTVRPVEGRLMRVPPLPGGHSRLQRPESPTLPILWSTLSKSRAHRQRSRRVEAAVED